MLESAMLIFEFNNTASARVVMSQHVCPILCRNDSCGPFLVLAFDGDRTILSVFDKISMRVWHSVNLLHVLILIRRMYCQSNHNRTSDKYCRTTTKCFVANTGSLSSLMAVRQCFDRSNQVRFDMPHELHVCLHPFSAN